MHVFYLEKIAAASSVFMSLDTYYIFSSFNTIFFVEFILHGNDVHRAYTFILPIRSCRNQPTNQPTATSTIRTECVILERSMTFIEYTLLRFFYPEHSKSVMKWNQKQKAKPKPESNRPDQHKLMPLVNSPKNGDKTDFILVTFSSLIFLYFSTFLSFFVHCRTFFVILAETAKPNKIFGERVWMKCIFFKLYLLCSWYFSI